MSWKKHGHDPDEITEGAEGLDLNSKDIPLYIIEHYGDDQEDTSRVKSKFNRALELLKEVYLEQHSEEDWVNLVRIDFKKASNPKVTKDEEKAEVDFVVPNKPMYRIFELEDLNELRGFTGEWLVQEKYDGMRIQIHKTTHDHLQPHLCLDWFLFPPLQSHYTTTLD